jgi:hypothetical protein
MERFDTEADASASRRARRGKWIDQNIPAAESTSPSPPT